MATNPADLHAVSALLDMVPIFLVGFSVLVFFLKKTGTKGKDDDSRRDDYQRYLRGERDAFTRPYESFRD